MHSILIDELQQPKLLIRHLPNQKIRRATVKREKSEFVSINPGDLPGPS
jgi:hypothetical protein